MPSTITTTAGATSPARFNHQRKLDRTHNGVLWLCVLRAASSRLEFWFSTNNGSSWSEDTSQRVESVKTSAGASMRIATRPDGAERMAVTYVRNDHVRMNLANFRANRQSFTWQQSNIIMSTAGGSSFWEYPDCDLAWIGGRWVAPTFWSRKVGDRTYLWWSRARWTESGTASVSKASTFHNRKSTVHMRPSVAIRHLGDDTFPNTSSPDLYISWAAGADGDPLPRQYLMRMMPVGSTWDTTKLRVMREAGVGGAQGGDGPHGATTVAFTGKTAVSVRAPFASGDTDNTTLQMHLMDPADSIREVIDVPDLAGGAIENVGVSWDNASGDIYIIANGASNANLKYIRYRWAVRQFDSSWTTFVTGEGATGNSLTVKPGSRDNRIECVYDIIAGSDRTARYELVASTNILPNTATWVTPTGAKNRSASLPLQWTHNDPDGDAQGAYTLERRINSGSPEYWNGATWQSTLVNVSSATQSVTLSSAWGTAGDTHEFRVRTSDADDFGPWSVSLPILATVIVNPTILSPTNNQNIVEPDVAVEWDVAEQSAFRVRLLDGAGNELFDSDWVGEPGTRVYEIPFDLQDGGSYEIELTTQNIAGLHSALQTVDITVSLAPPPVPTYQTTAIPDDGAIDVEINNHDPAVTPTIAAVGTAHTTTTDQSSKSVNCPAHNAGDRLILLMCWDGSPTVNSVSAVGGDAWVQRLHTTAASSAARLAVYEIVSRSSSGSSQSVTVGLSASEMGGAQILRVTNSHAAVGLEVSVPVTGTSNVPDPGELNPGTWGIDEVLWIALCGYDDGADTVTGYPTNYSGNQTNVRANSASGAGLGYATRLLEAEAEDPGQFTLSASEEWAAVTMAVPVVSYADTNDLYRIDNDAGDGIELQIARLLDPNVTFRDFSVAHDVDYDYIVVARSGTGATIRSDA